MGNRAPVHRTLQTFFYLFSRCLPPNFSAIAKPCCRGCRTLLARSKEGACHLAAGRAWVVALARVPPAEGEPVYPVRPVGHVARVANHLMVALLRYQPLRYHLVVPLRLLVVRVAATRARAGWHESAPVISTVSLILLRHTDREILKFWV